MPGSSIGSYLELWGTALYVYMYPFSPLYPRILIKQKLRSPGIEPGSITWQATIITTRPRTRIRSMAAWLGDKVRHTGSVNSVGRVLVL